MGEKDLDRDLFELAGDVTALLGQIPEAAGIFEKVRSQEITADEAVRQLIPLARNQGLFPELVRSAEEAKPMILELQEATNRPLMMETSTGISQMNPLLEAALIERASLDGDVPEFRVGPLPRGGRPAVPIETHSTDPVAVGWLLERATEMIEERFQIAQSNPERVYALTTTNEEGVQEVTGVLDYRAGEVPKPFGMSQADPRELALLTPEERRAYSYRALATTQGRVSLAWPIGHKLLEALQAAGFTVRSGKTNDPEAVKAEWTTRAFGAEDLSENFDYVRVAISALTIGILSRTRQNFSPDDSLLLEVVPVNGIADRRFGWTARVGRA